MGAATSVVRRRSTTPTACTPTEDDVDQPELPEQFGCNRSRLRQSISRESRLSRGSSENIRSSLEDKEESMLQTRYQTLCSIMQEPQELALYKAFLHTEYGIHLWDLWRCVEAYEDFRVQRLIQCSPDKGLHDKAVLAKAETLYATYLAPDAKSFVNEVPGTFCASVRDQLDKGIAPDCRALKWLLMVALCNERLLKSFAFWLGSEEAKAEAASVSARMRRTSEGLLLRADGGAVERIADLPPESPKRDSIVSLMSYASFRGTFDDLFTTGALGGESSSHQLASTSRPTTFMAPVDLDANDRLVDRICRSIEPEAMSRALGRTHQGESVDSTDSGPPLDRKSNAKGRHARIVV